MKMSERDPNLTYRGPFPTDRCSFQCPWKCRTAPRYINGEVQKVEMTKNGTWVTVRIGKMWRTKKRTFRVQRSTLAGWCPKTTEINVRRKFKKY